MTTTPAPTDMRTCAVSPVALVFGCSRASWFIVPRVVLEAMPLEWQQRFVDLFDELHDVMPWDEDCPPLAVFQVNEDGEASVPPPTHLNSYRCPDKVWLEGLSVGENPHR